MRLEMASGSFWGICHVLYLHLGAGYTRIDVFLFLKLYMYTHMALI